MYECILNDCYKGKFLHKTLESKRKCFAAEGESCSSVSEGITDLFHNGNCTYDSLVSKSKCFASKCEKCEYDRDCVSGRCYRDKCVYNTNACSKVIFQECQKIEDGHHSASRITAQVKCINKTPESKGKFLRASAKRTARIKKVSRSTLLMRTVFMARWSRSWKLSPPNVRSVARTCAFQKECDKCNSGHECDTSQRYYGNYW